MKLDTRRVDPYPWIRRLLQRGFTAQFESRLVVVYVNPVQMAVPYTAVQVALISDLGEER